MSFLSAKGQSDSYVATVITAGGANQDVASTLFNAVLPLGTYVLSFSLSLTGATGGVLGYSIGAVTQAVAFSDVTFTGVNPSLTTIYKSDGITALKVFVIGTGANYTYLESNLYRVRVV
jgi:hypothetical protein